jgi:FolB domain-containing protein
MDKIIIKDLSARGIIGVNPEERLQPQEILINVILYTSTAKAAQSDDIQDTVSYSVVAKKVRACAETAQRYTVEALAEDITKVCLSEPGVIKVQVRVEKPRAVRFANSVGVEIERENNSSLIGD